MDIASSAAAAHAGKILGPLAGRAAKELANKVLFRFFVWGRVRKRVSFRFPALPYVRWLKTITRDQLEAPVEEVAADLAKSLDNALSLADSQWASSAAGVSRALELVRRTYPAVAACLGDAQQAEICEHWARRRNAHVLTELMSVRDPGLRLSSADLAVVLRAESRARRRVRLQAFELEEGQLQRVFDAVRLPAFTGPSEVIVLCGDFGAGKSEVAESWHRAKVEEFAVGAELPFPVWVSARALRSESPSDYLDRRLGRVWRQRGARLVIDGLDETDAATAQALLESARVMAASVADFQCLITARPASVQGGGREFQSVEALDERQLDELFRACGSEWQSWRWSESVKRTLIRPFFALAAAQMIGEGRGRSVGDVALLKYLVENALLQGRERPVLERMDTYRVLESLAVNLTRLQHDGLTFAERQVARSSRLVAEGDGEVYFSLPIFQHWFAAQALLSGAVDQDEVTESPAAFGRWRWAAALAIHSTNSVDRLDDLLERWVRSSPGAAAWILRQAFRFDDLTVGSRTEPVSDDDAHKRVDLAFGAWADAVGALARYLLPPCSEGKRASLAVSVNGSSVTVVRWDGGAPAQAPNRLPADTIRAFYDQLRGPRFMWGGVAPVGLGWPWILVLQLIRQEMRQMICAAPFWDRGEPSVWALERRYALSRSLLGIGSLHVEPIPARRVRDAATALLQGLASHKATHVQLSTEVFEVGELRDLLRWLDESEITWVESELPPRDNLPGDGWVWGMYTPEALEAFELQVFDRACVAYDEAINGPLAPFAPAFPSSAITPFGVYLGLTPREEVQCPPILDIVRMPMAMMQDEAPRSGVWGQQRRAVIAERGEALGWEESQPLLERIRTWCSKQGVDQGFANWTGKGADEMASGRPASSVAAGWIWDGLVSVGLAEGSLGRFD